MEVNCEGCGRELTIEPKEEGSYHYCNIDCLVMGENQRIAKVRDDQG